MEPRLSYKYEFHAQNRFEWYQINEFLKEFSQTAQQLALEPKDVVHIGGTANFFRLCEVFGSKAIFRFRGTHDMDIVSFSQGSVRRVLESLSNNPNGIVEQFMLRRSLGLRDKKSVSIQFKKGMDPALSNLFDMDVYESDSGNVSFNDRILTSEKVILDPVEQVPLPAYRGLVGAPSLRDSFAFKTEILDYSKVGLRPKDEIDIMTSLRIAEEKDIPFSEIIEAIAASSMNRRSFQTKLSSIGRLITKPRPELEKILNAYPFLPSKSAREDVLHAISQYKNSMPS